MNAEDILTSLSCYLPSAQVEELRLNHAIKDSRDIILCMTINDILRSYNSTEENEHAVSELLSNLCKIHFSKK